MTVFTGISEAQGGHGTLRGIAHCAVMDVELASRIELLEAVAAKSEKALARQRCLIEELRTGGHRHADAEEGLQLYEVSLRRLREKLAALRREGSDAQRLPRSEDDAFAQSQARYDLPAAGAQDFRRPASHRRVGRQG